MPLSLKSCSVVLLRRGLFSLWLVLLLPGLVLSSERQIEIAINGTSEAEQVAATRLGLRILLRQASADQGLLNTEKSQAVVAEADKYALRVALPETASDGSRVESMPVTRRVRETGVITHVISVVFADRTIDELVADLTREREALQEETGDVSRETSSSAMLVWLIVRDMNRDMLIAPGDGVNQVARSNLIGRIREIAGASGQALIFPDALQVSPGVTALLEPGSELIDLSVGSYRTGNILTGVVARSSATQWRGDWRRISEEDRQSHSFTANSLDEMLEQAVAWSTGQSVSRGPAAADPGESSAMIWVELANNSNAYTATLSMLKELETVERVLPSDMSETGILFEVSPRSALSDISQRVKSLPWLTEVPVTEKIAAGAVGTSLNQTGLSRESIDLNLRILP